MQRKSRGSSLAPSTLEPWELLSCWEGKGELFALEQNLLHKVVLVRVRGEHLVRSRFDLNCVYFLLASLCKSTYIQEILN